MSLRAPADKNAAGQRLIYRTICCQKSICNVCILHRLGRNIWKDLWHDAMDSVYITCPAPSCSAKWAYRDFNEFERLMRAFGIDNLSDNKQRLSFCRAFNYRERLMVYRPSFTTAEWQAAKRLHRDLQKFGLMRVRPEQTAWNSHPFVNRPFVVSSIKYPGEPTLKVPLVLGQLALGSDFKTCVCCYTRYRQLEIHDETVRKAIAKGQLPSRSWYRVIQKFPSPVEFAKCAARHRLDTCRDYLTKHVASRLETLGAATCDALTCPEPGCNHVYTYYQVATLCVMDWELFWRYDRMLLRKQLAADPEFRWCLRAGCEAGQSHDTRICQTPGADGITMSWPRWVWCHACSFEMCFHHQTPWHHGQTCEEYDAAKRNEEDEATSRWMEDHAKRCPSCDSPVQKNGGCFHMTCTHCRAQFCWLCLADWKNIEWYNARGSLIYNHYGHENGCFFRLSDARPTEINGDDTLHAVLQAEDRQLWDWFGDDI